MRKIEMDLLRSTTQAIAARGTELTISQLAKRLGADYHIAKTLMQELVRKRMARKTDQRHFGGGEVRGSGVACVYQLGAR